MKNRWNITGVLATLIVVLVIPLQVVKHYSSSGKSMDEFPVYTGTSSCIECHRMEFDLWSGSDHDRAM